MVPATDAVAQMVWWFDEYRRLGLICRDGEFYPSVHYPPITMYPFASERALLGSYVPPPDNRFSIYVHIPFCLKACAFCHYPVKFLAPDAEMERYVDTVFREMDLWRERLGVDRIPARSILLGGGTPTYLSPGLLERFLDGFVSRLDLTRNTQFTVDVDPVTLLGDPGGERLRIMRAYGIERLTVGIQSLNDDTLRRMNRHHDASTALQCLQASRDAGFTLNIEFIYGYPGDTLDDWRAVIEQAVTLQVEEIQLYRLKMIPYGDRTAPLTGGFRGLNRRLPDPREVIAMKASAHAILNQHGFQENLGRVFTRDTSAISRYASNQCCGLYDQIRGHW